MDWHYEKDGSPVGPVSETQLQAARADGAVGKNTRVWREGWPDWKRAADVWPDDASKGPVLSKPLSHCAECGRLFPSSELVRFDNLEVCAGCQPHLVDKIRQGVAVGAGPWQDDNKLVMLKDSPLPDVCFKCGASPAKHLKKTLTWHSPLIYLTMLIGLVIYVVVALIVRKTTKVIIPLCQDCSRTRTRKMLLTWAGVSLGLGLIVMGAVLSADQPNLMGVFFLAGGAVIIGALLWVALTPIVIVKKIDKQHVWLARAGKPVLDQLPEWRG